MAACYIVNMSRTRDILWSLAALAVAAAVALVLVGACWYVAVRLGLL